MSRDKRGVVNPVVGGSSPPATAKLNRIRSSISSCPEAPRTNRALLSSPHPDMNDSAEATLQAGIEALRFESDLLRREAMRLVTVNRTLEARLALAVSEADVLRQRLDAIERSRPWRLAVLLRRWFGRQW